MSATGKGRLLRSPLVTSPGLRPPTATNLIDATAAVILNDYFWGGSPPTVTQIPYSWLSPPARFRPDQPRNIAAVTRTNGATARASSSASVTAVGERPFPATLDTQVVDDPANYAAWIVGNYTNPRQRMPQLALLLTSRTDVECWLILGREIGDRISITGTPVTWPDGVTELVIEGVANQVAGDTRAVVWNTAPVIGAAAGTAGPWFRADSSRTDTGSDLLAF